VLPLASAVVHSVNPWDMALWAAIALAVQIVVYLAVRLALPDVVVRHIPEGKVSAGVLLGAVSLAAGILNAACMTY
jgi:putative membrane protein